MNRLFTLISVMILAASLTAATTLPAEKLLGADKVTTAKSAPSRKAVELPASTTFETLLSEDFSKATNGSEAEPAAAEIEDYDAVTLQPGWTLYQGHEAGGSIYMAFDEIGDHGPGYVLTPNLDLTQGQQTWRLRCRAKNINPMATSQGLQMMALDNAGHGMVVASSVPLVYNEWTDCEWVETSGSTMTQLMLLGWRGKVLIDDITVEAVTMRLTRPEITGVTLTNYNEVTVDWEKSEGATSYVVEAYVEIEDEDGYNYQEVVASKTVGDENFCTLDFIPDSNYEYYIHVTAHDGDDYSLTSVYSASDLAPYEVGTPTVLPATNVTAEGFTANWDMAPFAAKYYVFPTHTRVAAEDEELVVLDEKFDLVPAINDLYNPLQMIPLLGMGNPDYVLSQAGWNVDLAIFAHVDQGHSPAMILSNMYAMMGLPGQLLSPEADYSVGDGTFTITGRALSSEGDILMTAGFMDAYGDIYSAEEFTISTPTNFNDPMGGNDFEVTITGAQPDSRLFICIVECEADEDMALFRNIHIAGTLKAGESFTKPVETIVTSGDNTSADVKIAFGPQDEAAYSVTGYYSMEMVGEQSEIMAVSAPTALRNLAAATGAAVRTAGTSIEIANPACEPVKVYDLSGACIAAPAAAEQITVEAAKGAYIVTVGNQAFKVVL